MRECVTEGRCDCVCACVLYKCFSHTLRKKNANHCVSYTSSGLVLGLGFFK